MTLRMTDDDDEDDDDFDRGDGGGNIEPDDDDDGFDDDEDDDDEEPLRVQCAANRASNSTDRGARRSPSARAIAARCASASGFAKR